MLAHDCDLTDIGLISRAAGGDAPAFQSLYDRHWKAVYSYAWLLTRSVSDAEDVTQECFLALLHKPGAFDPARAALRTWLIAIVRRQCFTRYRNLRHEAGSEELEHARTEAGFDAELIHQERASAVRAAVNALPQAQREALYLFEFEGLSLTEAAEVLEIEVNAVKARIFRAREQLKRSLSRRDL